MPNWTSNYIHVRGEESDIRAFLEAIKWQDELFDFNRIIPMPELLKNTGSGFMRMDGKEVRSWFIEERNPTGKDKVRDFSPEEKDELARIGYQNWYDWCVANWGTKWNAFHVDIMDNCQYGCADITFRTAWCAPVPVLRKFREIFPRLSFDCRWRDEDDSPYPHSLNDLT